MESRTECLYPSLSNVEDIINSVANVKLPTGLDIYEKHYLRPRVIFYDNKAAVYSINLDYLYPSGQIPLSEKNLKDQLIDEWNIIWEINSIATNQISDHFHPDHKEYYEIYIIKNYSSLIG
ncbi:hypothetical protein [Legionella tunisiensis]|uniref:hypothetical protein n=1 Tax=Legionella tunisiensis TaxID=1034944 RepID=UPI0002E7C652|nr:hypothetical protein [Legionella tunisiensis]